MKSPVVCAWCKAVLEEGTAGAPVSHGICDPCAEKLESHQAETEAVTEAAENRAGAFA